MKQVKSILRTDFCDELIIKEHMDDTYKCVVKQKDDFKITMVSITKEINSLNKEIGEYITIDFKNIYDAKKRKKLISIIKDCFLHFKIPAFKKVLIVGLGNEDVVCDALGPMSCEKVLVTSHLYKENKYELLEGTSNVAVCIPRVMGQTGIESAQMVASIQSFFRPDLIIVVDALATSSIRRINSAIQINNVGIKPGSGIGNHRKSITKKEMHCPVIAIGVATVISIENIMHSLFENYNEYTLKENNDLDMVVMPKDMDDILEYLSEIIGEGINYYIHPKYDEL